MERLRGLLVSLGYNVLVTREPGGSRLGEAIRALLLHHDKELLIGNKAELLLFLAARAQHMDEIIRPALLEDKIVLCDRFTDSTLAYQGYARKLGVDQVKALASYASDGISPHLTFYLDIDPKVGLQRARKSQKVERGALGKLDRIESQKIKFHALVRNAFLTIAADEPNRIKVLDATKSPDKVFDDALSYLS